MSLTKLTNARGTPVNPSAAVRNEAPATMKRIIVEVSIAPRSPSTNAARVSEPDTADSPSAPSTPSAAASVGVAIPP